MALRKGQKCHYCSDMADTWDHIVAKCFLPKSGIPMREHQLNKVPCCTPCNRWKKNYRADCTCEICEAAWVTMAPYILPRLKRDISIVIMADRETDLTNEMS